MHFSIPDTQEFTDTTGNSYLGYNIHINGLFHCTVRYRQLHNLHEHLTKDTNHPLPPFPPKKLFPLTSSQQEERRLCLEKYIQTIGQDSSINSCPLLNSFFLNAQQETSNKMNIMENLEIHLPTSAAIALKVSTNDNATSVLKKLARYLNLPDQFDNYFALFAMIETEAGANILRKLEDFESPVLTIYNINYQGIKIVISRNYWNIENDLILMRNSVALDLLYHQGLMDIARSWICVPKELEEHLERLIADEDKLRALELMRTFKHYGFIKFSPCYCDYPKPGTRAIVGIGRNELNLRILGDDDHEAVFKVTRMRCWRITTLHNGIERNFESDYSLELSFEYLIGKNQLQWITVSSEQAILMSVSLQSMIDQLIVKDHLVKSREEVRRSWSYVLRDGHSKIIVGDENRMKREEVRRGTKSRGRENCDIMENNAFHMIGDDDL